MDTRWVNCLRPECNFRKISGNWTEEEDELLVSAVATHQTDFVLIEKMFKFARNRNDLNNRWNSTTIRARTGRPLISRTKTAKLVRKGIWAGGALSCAWLSHIAATHTPLQALAIWVGQVFESRINIQAHVYSKP